MNVISENLEETKEKAIKLKNKLCEEDKNTHKARVVGFYGELGSGKTTFIQYLGETFGIKEKLLSPTFVIEKIYNIKNNRKFNRFIHIDAYRLEEAGELRTLGWEEILRDSKNLIVVEWGGKVEELLPKDTLRVYLEFIDENKRRIQW